MIKNLIYLTVKVSCILLLFCLFLFACNDKKSTILEKDLYTDRKDKVIDNKIKFLIKGNHIIIRTIIRDSIEANIILDTGAGGGLVLDSAFVKNKGIIPKEYYASPNTFAGRGKYIRGTNKVTQEPMPISINNITDTLSFTPIYNLRGILGSDKADGILGMDFMEKYVMEINYEENYLIFHKPETYEKPDNLTTIPMKYEAKPNRYFIDTDFKITNSLTVRQNALIDLGAGGSGITFCTYAVKKHNLMNVIKDKTQYISKNRTPTGDYFNGYLAKINSVSLHGMVIDTPRVTLLSTEKGQFSSDLILIGNYIFTKYKRVVFDFGRSKIYITNQSLSN